MAKGIFEAMAAVMEYDKATGLFTKKQNSNKWKAGHILGSKDKDGYTIIKFNGMQHKAHRIAWYFSFGSLPENEIDHINGVRNDNRICNLRLSSRIDNCRNRAIPSNNTSGVIGVTWKKGNGKWNARGTLDGQRVELGLYDNLDDAKKARMEWQEKNNYSK